MSRFVKVNTDFDPTVNFWDLNPQLIFMIPFNKVYALDGGGFLSSAYMWTVYFISDPDETVNKFFKFGRVKIQSMLEETYFKENKPNWQEEAYVDALEAYPEVSLNAVQRAFLLKKQHIVARAKFLNEQEYTLDTVAKLDLAHGKTSKILDEYDKIEEKFFLEKSKGARVKGGRKQSKSEKGEI